MKVGRTELQEALMLAKEILDRPNADPDDDLAILARQLKRARAEIDQLQQHDKQQHHNQQQHHRLETLRDSTSLDIADLFKDSIDEDLAASLSLAIDAAEADTQTAIATMATLIAWGLIIVISSEMDLKSIGEKKEMVPLMTAVVSTIIRGFCNTHFNGAHGDEPQTAWPGPIESENLQ